MGTRDSRVHAHVLSKKMFQLQGLENLVPGWLARTSNYVQWLGPPRDLCNVNTLQSVQPPQPENSRADALPQPPGDSAAPREQNRTVQDECLVSNNTGTQCNMGLADCVTLAKLLNLPVPCFSPI